MKIYTLKSIAQRGVMLGAAFALAVSTVTPFAPAAFADALNPLTDRSLTLSSSSPGWDYLDGSGNALYAPPNSGANGQKTGNTFEFKVSTDTTSGANVKAITFQYCTTSAGACMGPGNNGYSAGDPEDGDAVRQTNVEGLANSPKTSDLQIQTATPSQIEQANLADHVDTATGLVTDVPAAGVTGNNFIVMYNNAGTWTSSDDWTMTTQENQFGDEADGESTAKNNQITLVNTTGQGFTAGQEVKVVFFATTANYITNPGSGAFFVKINTYNHAADRQQANVIDGGVTVANVMNQSIQITTKVLETMDFSVGTVDPLTLSSGASSQLATATGVPNRTHQPCDQILKGMTPTDSVNTLQMGNALGEFSLETAHTYSTHSYWRLSSNSSAGATVYYSGNTLSNTVNDKIDPINQGNGVATGPAPGSEQFGLALANGSRAANPQPLSSNPGSIHAVNYAVERNADPAFGLFENGADNLAAGIVAGTGIHSSVATDLTGNLSYHSPRLYPLIPDAEYDRGAGVVNDEYGTINTAFAFDETSQTVPIALATQDTEVVDCVTAKMRYIANIAATTPAGIYTTKINYIAAPQY